MRALRRSLLAVLLLLAVPAPAAELSTGLTISVDVNRLFDQIKAVFLEIFTESDAERRRNARADAYRIVAGLTRLSADKGQLAALARDIAARGEIRLADMEAGNRLIDELRRSLDEIGRLLDGLAGEVVSDDVETFALLYQAYDSKSAFLAEVAEESAIADVAAGGHALTPEERANLERLETLSRDEQEKLLEAAQRLSALLRESDR